LAGPFFVFQMFRNRENVSGVPKTPACITFVLSPVRQWNSQLPPGVTAATINLSDFFSRPAPQFFEGSEPKLIHDFYVPAYFPKSMSGELLRHSEIACSHVGPYLRLQSRTAPAFEIPPPGQGGNFPPRRKCSAVSRTAGAKWVIFPTTPALIRWAEDICRSFQAVLRDRKFGLFNGVAE